MAIKPYVFHKFGELPQELKDMIWGFAADARPPAPGAHMFHHYDRANDGRVAPEGEGVVVISSNTDTTIVSDTKTVISIPQPVPLGDATAEERAKNEGPGLNQEQRESQWIRNQKDHRLVAHGMPNPSMYLVDGGLWTACRDSRWAMKKRFRSKYHGLPLEKSAGSDPRSWDVVDMPATGYIIPREPMLGQPELGVRVEPWFFTVFPQQDLFIFPLEDVFAQGARIPPDWFKTTRALNLNPASRTREWGHASGFRNIAFTWNPAWDYEHHISTRHLIGKTELFGNHMMADRLFDIVDSLEGKRDEPPQKVWIIDHRIKRKKFSTREVRQNQASMDEKEEVVFYGTDRKYTAVPFRGGDDELPIPWEGDREWCESSTPASLISTIGNSAQLLEDQIEEFLADHGVLWDCRVPEIGLLACEILDESTAPH